MTSLPTLPDLDSVFEGSISAGDLEDFYNVLGESSTPGRKGATKTEDSMMIGGGGGGQLANLEQHGIDFHVMHGGDNFEDYVYTGSGPSSSSSMSSVIFCGGSSSGTWPAWRCSQNTAKARSKMP